MAWTDRERWESFIPDMLPMSVCPLSSSEWPTYLTHVIDLISNSSLVGSRAWWRGTQDVEWTAPLIGTRKQASCIVIIQCEGRDKYVHYIHIIQGGFTLEPPLLWLPRAMGDPYKVGNSRVWCSVGSCATNTLVQEEIEKCQPHQTDQVLNPSEGLVWSSVVLSVQSQLHGRGSVG